MTQFMKKKVDINDADEIVQRCMTSPVTCVLGDVAQCITELFANLHKDSDLLKDSAGKELALNLYISIIATLSANFDREKKYDA